MNQPEDPLEALTSPNDPAAKETREGAEQGHREDDAEDQTSDRGRSLSARGRSGAPRSSERIYIVAYDIADQKRWRRVYKTMNGYGRWLQLSVFQCRLSGRRRAELGMILDRLIHHTEDHVVILDLGPADMVELHVESFGKSFTPITREAIIF